MKKGSEVVRRWSGTRARQDHWRWNVDPVWENYSGLVEEAWHAQNVQNDFARAKHLRSALTFASTSLEAFSNRCMREWLERHNTPEEEIYSRLRNTKFKEKLNVWPAEFCDRKLEIGLSAQRLFDLVADFQDVRNELIHPKAKDHSIYERLD